MSKGTFLYPALLNNLSEGGGGSFYANNVSDKGTFIFKNGERLKGFRENPNTTNIAFWKNFTFPFYRIPNMIITDTGKIVCVADCRSRASDQTAIFPAVGISSDKGRTWKKKVLYDPCDDGGPTQAWNNDFTRFMDPTLAYYKGRIHLFCGKWNGTSNNGNWTGFVPNDSTWNVFYAYSDDDGETWTSNTNWNNDTSKHPASGQTDWFAAGASWFGGVGQATITRFGTLCVPVQWTNQRGKVWASFIYTNDGVNWKKLNKDAEGISENSLTQWPNNSGKSEIIMYGRKDPNTGEKKAIYYVQQTDANTFTGEWVAYPNLNDKVPAPGGSGCSGSCLVPLSSDGQRVSENGLASLMVTYPCGYFNKDVNTFLRDHLVLAMFGVVNRTKYFNDETTLQRPLETILLDTGCRVGTNAAGGYSNIYYNHNAKMFGVVYENQGGISYKDLSHWIPVMLYKNEIEG